VVWVHGDVFESDLASIGGARRATIVSPAYPDRLFEGRAVAIGATQGDVPGAVEAWFEVPNPGGLLKIGAVVEVGIEQGRPDSSLVLPRSAVVEKDGRRLVFVHTAPEEFTAREVMITSRLGERVAVRGSLEAGERVVVSGSPSLLAAPVIGMGR
jgi:multidrug efflux pump subunit AcrA (membrane-fusion protein)